MGSWAAAMLVFSGSAGALTLGSTLVSGSSTCSADPGDTEEVIQTSTDPSYDYVVPVGGGLITSWSFNTTDATPGTPYGLVIVRPSGGGYTVVGADEETVPTSPPTIQTYTLSTPIQVQAGDLIASVITSSSHVHCVSIGLSGSEQVSAAEGTPTAGSTLSIDEADLPGYLANIEVNLVQSEDVGITQTVTQGSIATGGTSAFLLSVNDAGPANAPVTITDAVPSGLKIDSVAAGSNSCTVAGQIITCAGVVAPASIAVIVTASQTGSFTNNANVSTSLTDPNLTNNTSAATLQVTGAISTALKVTKIKWRSLAKLPLSEAKTVIRDLGCKVGKVTRKHSKSVGVGEVISTSAHAGQEVAVGSTIKIVASAGKPN